METATYRPPRLYAIRRKVSAFCFRKGHRPRPHPVDASDPSQPRLADEFPMKALRLVLRNLVGDGVAVIENSATGHIQLGLHSDHRYPKGSE